MKTLAGPLALLCGLIVAETADAMSTVAFTPASSPTGFDVVSISVPDNAVWQINRPIEIAFNAPVAFATVNANTIQIRTTTTGMPAVGTFYLVDPLTVGFQPGCPTSPDLSDAGFQPGGVQYTLLLPGGGTGPTVQSAAGFELKQSHAVHFTTPTIISPTVLFFDTAAGPPQPIIQTSPAQLDACYVEIGQDPDQRVYFAPPAVFDPELGAGTPAGFRAPLNLHSNVRTRVAIVVVLNQAINPLPFNLHPDRVRLEYRVGPGTWRVLPHTVELDANCTQTGAIVRVTPIGILPQRRLVRVVLAAGFEDIVGESLLIPLTVGSFPVATAFDPGTTTPGDAADEVLEEFLVGGGGPGSLEDTQTPLAETRAVWGGGALTASLANFTGSGGPGGNFDWQIGNNLAGMQPPVILDTTFSVITDVTQTVQEVVINGQVDVRDFTVKANGTLVIQGPNPCRILVSGTVRIDGKIKLTGGNNLGPITMGTTSLPEPGAPGQAGGGRGGAGSYFATQSTPAGESGYGAFNVPAGGGAGGETGYNPNLFNAEFRRPGGGGGGALGMDALIPNGIAPNTGPYVNVNLCPNQSLIGLDAEKGFPGAPQASGAFHPGTQPAGGAAGPRPFFDGDPANDFWGSMRTQAGQVVHGELSTPWAGAGGGGGGDAIASSSFPQNPFDPNGYEKGAGGGGGGGSLAILALGEIVFGAAGRIDAGSGTGTSGGDIGGGGVQNIGGGSGGGAGGHVVLQTATRIDFTLCKSTTNPPGGIYALGGQGGAGRNDLGGAHNGGFPTSPQLDALPQNSYPSSSAPCKVVNGQAGYTSTTNTVGDLDPLNVVIGAGGDGGPGIIQLHAPTLADILKPVTAGESIFKIIMPPPIGSFPPDGVPTLSTINNPLFWDQTIPRFGRKSQAISKWIVLGAASVDPMSPAPGAVHTLFGGTSSGVIVTNGIGPGATVLELPPIFVGTISSAPTVPPFVTADARTLVLDGTLLPDDIYLRNAMLCRRFVLRLTHGATTAFDVVSASYVAAIHQLRLTVSASGMPLAGYVAGDMVELRPRFFRVLTDGVADSLPDSSRILIEFQATTENLQGNPDTVNASAWVGDITTLDPNVGANPDYRFVRFRVTFDTSTSGAPLTPQTPVPSLDFLRIPFRF